MKTASRIRLQNHPVAERRPVRTPRPITRLGSAQPQKVAPRVRPRQKTRKAVAPLPNGLNVIALLMSVCAVIVAMLVVSLSWQRNAYALAQQEVELRSALDQTSDERQQVLTEQRRALNPRETAARSASAGLNEFKLDERTTTVVAKPKTSASSTTTNQKTKSSAKTPSQTR